MRLLSELTSALADLLGAISELLDFFLGQNTEHYHTVHALFEALLGLLQGFRVDEATVDPGPASAYRDILSFERILVGCNAFTDGLGVFWKLLRRLAKDSLDRCHGFLGGLYDLYALAGRL